MKDTSCFRLKFGGRLVTFIAIDIFCPLITHLGWTATHSKKGSIILEGPPRCLSGPEIADMLANLVHKENGDGFVRYVKEHN
jgi:hypothetical protein